MKVEKVEKVEEQFVKATQRRRLQEMLVLEIETPVGFEPVSATKSKALGVFVLTYKKVVSLDRWLGEQ